ncbi:MAG: hypothetical protein EOP43_02885 [Sphingobacteriaceae bacterium]|nr:MAG: hypothetical protein EOP43_02885 [Sphingobacteriaceae bacterium]
MIKKEIPQREIDRYFNYYSDTALTDNSKIIRRICAWFAFLSLLGLSWIVPFPALNFLGRYNSYFNWASFVIAFSIYYYSKLSPLLSYAMLFSTLILSYAITVLQKQLTNNLLLANLFFLILVVCVFIQFVANKKAVKNSPLKMGFLFIWIGPIWVLHFLLKKWSVKY